MGGEGIMRELYDWQLEPHQFATELINFLFEHDLLNEITFLNTNPTPNYFESLNYDEEEILPDRIYVLRTNPMGLTHGQDRWRYTFIKMKMPIGYNVFNRVYQNRNRVQTFDDGFYFLTISQLNLYDLMKDAYGRYRKPKTFMKNPKRWINLVVAELVKRGQVGRLTFLHDDWDIALLKKDTFTGFINWPKENPLEVK